MSDSVKIGMSSVAPIHPVLKRIKGRMKTRMKNFFTAKVLITVKGPVLVEIKYENPKIHSYVCIKNITSENDLSYK